MILWLNALMLVALAYFCGALPFGFWAGKWKRIDIREHGSKNIGATNVIRVLGKRVGVPVFIMDMLKGLLPTMLAQWWMEHLGASPDVASLVAVCCAAATVLGHMFTFWLGFKGGKGVATSAGAVLGLAPLSLLIAIIVWVVTYYLSRFVALASIIAAVFLPIAMVVTMTLQHRWNFVMLGFGIVIGVLVIVRHRANIARLLSGTENKFEKKKQK